MSKDIDMKVFAVYDSKAEAYLAPFFMPSKGAVIRSFTDLVNDSSHIFGKHPEDYILFELGEWDEFTAKFTLLPAPFSIGVGTEFLRSK